MPVALMGAVLRISVSILDRFIPCCALCDQKVITHLCGCECDLLYFSCKVGPHNAIGKSVPRPGSSDRLRNGIRNTFRVFHAAPFSNASADLRIFSWTSSSAISRGSRRMETGTANVPPCGPTKRRESGQNPNPL